MATLKNVERRYYPLEANKAMLHLSSANQLAWVLSSSPRHIDKAVCVRHGGAIH